MNSVWFIAKLEAKCHKCDALCSLKKKKWKIDALHCIVGYILSFLQSHNASNLWYFAIAINLMMIDRNSEEDSDSKAHYFLLQIKAIYPWNYT